VAWTATELAVNCLPYAREGKVAERLELQRQFFNAYHAAYILAEGPLRHEADELQAPVQACVNASEIPTTDDRAYSALVLTVIDRTTRLQNAAQVELGIAPDQPAAQ
jgi:hypothetical protein